MIIRKTRPYTFLTQSTKEMGGDLPLGEAGLRDCLFLARIIRKTRPYNFLTEGKISVIPNPP